MLNEKIDQLIMEAMITGNNDELKVFRAIKNNFLLFKTARMLKTLTFKDN